MATRSSLNNILTLLDEYEPQIRDAFIAAIQAATNAIDVQALQAALVARNIDAAVDLLEIPLSVLYPLDAAIAATYVAGGSMITDSARRAGVLFGFDGRHPRAEQWVRGHVGDLITEIAATQREAVTTAVRGVIENQIVAGASPRTAALDIVGRRDRVTGTRTGGIVGLDAPRAERLRIVSESMKTPEGVQSLIEGGRVKYKVNKATEARILRAAKQGKAVSEADRVLSIKQYGNQLLKERGETIARTESITALRAGRREGMVQAIESGEVDRDAVTRTWDATMDSRTRPDHQTMNGQVVEGETEPWVLPDGSRMMFPGDTSLGASAKQTIQCRCYERWTVDWLRGV